MKLVVVNSSRQAITVFTEGVRISFVHASYLLISRSRLWRKLNGANIDIPWLVMGDFNCVLRNEEKKGGLEPRLSATNEFSDWMDDNNFFEVDSLGTTFTWENGKSGVQIIITKLDHAIINEAWLTKFENWRYFIRVVNESWNTPVVGNPDFIFPYKLKCLKLALKDWNQHVFGNVNVHLKQTQLHFESAINISDADPTDEAKFNSMKDASEEVQDIRVQQNIMLKQKSINKWLFEGSSNLSFFHSNIWVRRNNNTIYELVDDSGMTITDCDQLRIHVVNYYESKFNSTSQQIEE
ncbi:uncharacterized protein LOC113354130 [Papaver somniferum]|uniref:uncharacterized protein LOC113354130 n=1 Tax=Papaver somniferum TaxID=3469 RepID=UPI000E7059EA|nr:uncharacterized protein LOC113354130 [Papaver somniferum]